MCTLAAHTDHGNDVKAPVSSSGAPVLNRDRFEKFLDSVGPRLPIKGKVSWLSAAREAGAQETSLLVDMTPDVTDASLGRRMFVQVCHRDWLEYFMHIVWFELRQVVYFRLVWWL